MSKSRMPLYLGLGVAGAGGYYLYRSGGDASKAKAIAQGKYSIHPFPPKLLTSMIHYDRSAAK